VNQCGKVVRNRVRIKSETEQEQRSYIYFPGNRHSLVIPNLSGQTRAEKATRNVFPAILKYSVQYQNMKPESIDTIGTGTGYQPKSIFFTLGPIERRSETHKHTCDNQRSITLLLLL
jgi:hypothetical protein